MFAPGRGVTAVSETRNPGDLGVLGDLGDNRRS
jgi:hypothetical protein